MKHIFRLTIVGLIGFMLLGCNLTSVLEPNAPEPTSKPVETSPPIIEPEPTRESEPTPTPVEPVSLVDGQLDPCALVTSEEAELIMGEPATPPKDINGACTFTNAKNGMYVVSIAAAQDEDTSGVLQGQAMLLGFAGAKVDQEFMERVKPLADTQNYLEFFKELASAAKESPSAKVRLFSGGGNDLVYWAWLISDTRRQGAFVGIRDTTMVNINVVVADTRTEEDMLAAATTLANDIFTRLPQNFTLPVPGSLD
jgi:hypothetical protein